MLAYDFRFEIRRGDLPLQDCHESPRNASIRVLTDSQPSWFDAFSRAAERGGYPVFLVTKMSCGQRVYEPYTGEEFEFGILIDADQNRNQFLQITFATN